MIAGHLPALRAVQNYNMSNEPDRCIYESWGDLDEILISDSVGLHGLRVCAADMFLKPHFEEAPNVCQEVRLQLRFS